MAVVPRADETILGAAPGSPFPGNFLGTQATPSTHLPGARAASSPCCEPVAFPAAYCPKCGPSPYPVDLHCRPGRQAVEG